MAGKLFSLERFLDDEAAEGTLFIPNSGSAEGELNRELELEIEEGNQDLQVILESYGRSVNELHLLSNVQTKMTDQQSNKLSYFQTLDNYQPVLNGIASNLGVKTQVPCIEDFQNPYGFKASHEVAMEGISDFIKRVWAKLKEIVTSFFKKIMLFFKRILGYDLELENYEQYLDEMIGKIKARKGTITDTRLVIDSKLPSLLANEGMESIDSDFVLSTGLAKIRQIADVMDNVFTKKLSGLHKNLEQNVKEALTATIQNFQTASNDEAYREAMYAFKDVASVAIRNVFEFQTGKHQIPDQPLDAMFHHFSRDELKGEVMVYSLVDSSDSYRRLPKDFNMYFFQTDDQKFFVTASVINNTYVKNKLNPISNRDNLIDFHRRYRDMTRRIDIAKMNKVVGDVEKSINALISNIRNGLSSALDHTPKSGFTETIINQLYDDSAFASASADLGVLQTNIVAEFTAIYTQNTAYRSLVDKELAKQGISVSGSAAYQKAITEIQNYMLGYFNAIQVMLKDVATNLASIYTELRYELIKFIYNSAKAYTTM